MPSADFPPEVWARIFFFVARPLPYIGMEEESFAEDAKEWRGNPEEKGLWKGIDALMLVSKRINELVSPVFWSYLVLSSSARASALGCHVYDRDDDEVIVGYVKVLSVLSTAEPDTEYQKGRGEHPCQTLFAYALNLVHLHFRDEPIKQTDASLLVTLAMRPSTKLRGVTGLVLGTTNLEAATLALRHLSPHLRRLSVFSILSSFPPSMYGFYRTAGLRISFPELSALATGTLVDGADKWLDELRDDLWTTPAVRKIAIGAVPSQGHHVGSHDWFIGDSAISALDALYLPDVTDVATHFGWLGGMGVRELAVGLDMDNTVVVEPDAIRLALDGAEGGKVDSIEVVVVVHGLHDRKEHALACLVEIVNRKRMPMLKKVVWVSDDGDAEAETWTGPLLRWTHQLIKSGCDFEVQ